MILEIHWIIIVITLAICFITTIFCIIVPLEVWQEYPILNYTIKKDHIKFQNHLLRDIRNKSCVERTNIIMRYSLSVLIYSGKEIVVLIIIFYYFSNIRGSGMLMNS
jgi:uncharacterized membrane protein YdbT with pleckstrin-like domain